MKRRSNIVSYQEGTSIKKVLNNDDVQETEHLTNNMNEISQNLSLIPGPSQGQDDLKYVEIIILL